MKAAFGVEAIGLDASTVSTARRTRTGATLTKLARPWVAELTGPDTRHGFERQFIRAKWDFTQANTRGTRGIWFWWTLESGRVYEARYRTDWSLTSMVRRFLTVTDEGEIRDLTREEVQTWLAGCSGSTSSTPPSGG